MSIQNFLLPDVGEGLTEAEIVSWCVSLGDRVEIDDVIVHIETAKSLVELPSPFFGIVQELIVAEGDVVSVGSPIISIAENSDIQTSDEQIESESTLVGYGAKTHPPRRRKKQTSQTELIEKSSGVIAKPSIRKLAKDLGVDLSEISTGGESGEITREDVLEKASQSNMFRNIKTPDWGDSREETISVKNEKESPHQQREQIIAVSGVRKIIASGMVQSAHTSPHVSVWTDVDATRTVDLIKHLKTSANFPDVKISNLLFIARAVIWAIRRNPMVNAVWVNKEEGAEIIVRNYVNLGIAVATPRGLLVPNIKDAQKLSLHELACSLDKLVTTAREGKTQPIDQKNGTITITNIGVFGMDAGTPIINPGEAGIVALGAIRKRPWVVGDLIQGRWVTTVSGSFDHRVIDGDGMSRFIADVASILEEPALLLE